MRAVASRTRQRGTRSTRSCPRLQTAGSTPHPAGGRRSCSSAGRPSTRSRGPRAASAESHGPASAAAGAGRRHRTAVRAWRQVDHALPAVRCRRPAPAARAVKSILVHGVLLRQTYDGKPTTAKKQCMPHATHTLHTPSRRRRFGPLRRTVGWLPIPVNALHLGPLPAQFLASQLLSFLLLSFPLQLLAFSL